MHPVKSIAAISLKFKSKVDKIFKDLFFLRKSKFYNLSLESPIDFSELKSQTDKIYETCSFNGLLST